tara:strand:+ start:206 stop:427 length:222 start_codon:yes stop_codon:yes gene_type:complete
METDDKYIDIEDYDVIAQCPYCDELNGIELDLYPVDKRLGLYHLCGNCYEMFGFDIEMQPIAISYETKNPKLQ